MNNARDRKPHAVLNLPSRRQKAEKILRLLNLDTSPEKQYHVLEIGTGSGGIAHYFAHHPELNCKVFAIDVTDNRQLTEGYEFQLVDGVKLPYEDNYFDIVISNHVIEHVGEHENQLEHLREAKRVLKTDGTGYLAVPNRWMLVEPHYKLPFLSWLPERVASYYLRLMKKGEFYDCRPLTLTKLDQLFQKLDLQKVPLEREALKALGDIEGQGSRIQNFVSQLPEDVFGKLRWLCPTLICRFTK